MPLPKPLVSVLIPCHNYGRFLGQAIESVIAQSCEDWECIVVDDGSSDNTTGVMNHYIKTDDRIHYFKQENRGVSAARNTALNICQGDFIQLLDADDKIQSDKLAIHAEYLLSHPDVDLVYGGASYFYEADGNLETKVSDRINFPNISASGRVLLKSLIRRNIMVTSSPLIRRTSIHEAGYFNTKLHGHEDWEYWLRLATIGKTFHYLKSDNSNAMVRVHARSAVQKTAAMLWSNLQVRREIGQMTLDPSLHRINRRGTGYQLVKLAKFEAHGGNIKAALRHAVKATLISHGSLPVLLALLMPLALSTRLAILTSRLTSRLQHGDH